MEIDAYWPNSQSDSNCRSLMCYAADAIDAYCMLFDPEHTEHTIGRAKMDQLLRALFTKYEYGVETPADVRASAQSVAGRDLSAFWAKWRNVGD